MKQVTFWTGAKPATIKRTVGLTLQRMTSPPPHKFVPVGDTRYVPEPDEIVLAMGSTALALLAKDGLVPKNRTVDNLRGKVFHQYMVGYDPGAIDRDPGLESEIIWDTQLAARFALTGSLNAHLGDYRWVDHFGELVERIEQLYECTGKPVAVSMDCETFPISPFQPNSRIVSIGFTEREGYADLLYCPDLTAETASLVRRQIAWLLTTPKIKLRGANLKFDLNWVLVKWGIDCTNFAMDTLIVGSLIDELRSNGLKNHVKAYCTELGGYDSTLLKGDIEAMHKVPKERHLYYLGGDVDGTLRVSNKLLAEINPQKNLTRFYTQIMHRGAVAFQRIEREGICVSFPRIKQLQADLETTITNLSSQGLKLLPSRLRAKYLDNLSLSRAALLKDYFFSPMGLNLKPRLFTAKSKLSDPTPSTAKNHLEMFFDVPEAKAMCSVLDELGQAKKCLSTYVIGFMDYLRSDGRWHPTYFLHNGAGEWGGDDGGTDTGRTSAKGPAIQTIPSPKKTIWGQRIRECMIAPPGQMFVEADFSQGELRIAACIADETAMLRAYGQGIDLHCKTGASVHNIPLDVFLAMKQTDPKRYDLIRAKAKSSNFGVIYGISPEGYKAYAWNGFRIAMPLVEAQQTITSFFETYPDLPTWHRHYKKMAHRDGYVVSPLGRVRHLPHINSPFREVASKAERQAINSVVQSTLSDMMVWAIGRLNDSHPQFAPCAMIHDSGIWAVPEDQAEEAAVIITQEMGNLPLREVFGWSHQISFPSDASLGHDMGQMTEIKIST